MAECDVSALSHTELEAGLQVVKSMSHSVRWTLALTPHSRVTREGSLSLSAPRRAQ